MDFEEELRKFARSDVPLRHTRESARWHIEIWVGDQHILGEARDVSRGGLGAVICPDDIWQMRLAIGCQVMLSLLGDEDEAEHVDRIPARVIWLREIENVWEIGFEFFDLDENADRHIERYLLARIVTRHLEEDDTTD